MRLRYQVATWTLVAACWLCRQAVAVPEDYPLLDAAGSCTATLLHTSALNTSLATIFALNDSTPDVRPVTLRLALANKGWKPVLTPWTLSLVNPGYLDAYDHHGFTLASEVEYGVVTLLSTQADQLLLPFAGNEVTVTVTVESDSDYSQPLNILLDNQPCQIEVTEELASRPAQPLVQPLTTRDGQIIGIDGEVIDLKGIAWFGFDDGNSMLDGLWEPEVEVDFTGLSMELSIVVQRLQLLGFNAVRLPMTFQRLLYPDEVQNYTRPCEHPDLVQVVESAIPPDLTITLTNETAQDLEQAQLQETYPLEEGICNPWMRNMTSPLERFLWVVNFFTHNGFYVAVVQQSNYEPITLDNQLLLVPSWRELLVQLSEDPITRIRLLIDPFNELDKFYIQWENNQTNGMLGQGDLYLAIFDALYEVNPYVLFLVQGTGQKVGGLVANHGDGLATDATVLKSFGGALSDPNPFFRQLLRRPYLNQVVIAPHVYPPSISQVEGGPTTLGFALYKRLSDAFGYLNDRGYCLGTFCHKFAVILGETGSGFNTLVDIDFMDDLAIYMHNIDDAYDGRHSRIGSFFLWSWNANAALELGLLEPDWQTVKWRYMEYLQYLGLQPWYLKPSPQRISESASGTVTDVVFDPLPVITIPSPPPPLPCPNIEPGGEFTCEQQKTFGKCNEAWLLDYCAATCDRCYSYKYPPPGPACPDVAPDPTFTCEQQASFNKCNESWMLAGGYCALSCKRCDHPFSLILGGAPGIGAPAPGPAATPLFPEATGEAGYPLNPEQAPYGQAAPVISDVHSGVDVQANASQAELASASGAVSATTQQAVDPSLAVLQAQAP